MAKFLRAAIAKNVQARADVVFKDAPNKPVAICEASGGLGGSHPRLVKSTVQRILKCETSATLEQLEGLARALDVAVYQLLLPDLDPSNPQVAKGAAKGETRAYGPQRAKTPTTTS